MMRSVAAAVLCILTCAAVSAQPVRIRGTRVSLDPPAGFSPAPQFAGFQNPDLQSAIMVTELPGPASVMQRGMTKTALASRGMTLLESSTASVDGQDALLLRVRQASASGDVLKWMLIAGDQTRTVMVVGTYPTAADTAVGEAIRRSLLNARLGNGTAAPDSFEGLRFRVTPTPFLKLAGRVNDMLTLTETGTMTPGTRTPPSTSSGTRSALSRLEIFGSFPRPAWPRPRARAGSPTSQDGPRGWTGWKRMSSRRTRPTLKLAVAFTFTRRLRPIQVVTTSFKAFVSLARATVVVPEFKAVTRTFRRAAEH